MILEMNVVDVREAGGKATTWSVLDLREVWTSCFSGNKGGCH